MIDFLKENFIWIAGIVTSIKWTYEYTQKLKWDKSKILLDRLEDFLGRESTKKVHQLLDWNKVVMELGGEKKMIDDEMFYNALITHNVKMNFTSVEWEIRGLFDEYLDGITEFLILSECGLLSRYDYMKFMSYWFDILSARSVRKSDKLHQQIKTYMRFYGFQKVYDFVHRKPLLLKLGL